MMIPRQDIQQRPLESYELVFKQGLDQVTPSKYTIPGSLREAQNYEIDINGGYASIEGYERFDGQAKPSAAVYAILDVTITGSFSNADTITGVDSSATAVILSVVTSGAQDYLVITKIVGTFNSSEDLQVSAVTEGNTDAATVIGGASTKKLNAQYKNLAADDYRDDIAAVPGSGNILGIWMLSDIKYAFRNNTGGTAADLYKSTSSGWSQVALGRELSFTSGGTTEIVEGNTITGATSSATAVITRVALESGSWAAGTAAGRFIFATQTGTFQSEDLNVGASTNLATIAGDATAITLSASGRYEFVNSNFGGQAGSKRIYGCDTVNRGFEFDGTIFVPIATAMTTDTPNHVTAHENHLFFSFEGTSQHSGIGTPYIWSPIFGASELAVGDTITAYKVQPGESGNSTLLIFSRNKINVLYGTSSADWTLVDYREEVGAYKYSVQEFGMTMMVDDRGIDNLVTVQAYGNFQHNTLSRLIQPFINARKTKLKASNISREKSQYRVFFSDKYAVYMTTNNRKVIGMTPILFNNPVLCTFSLEAVDGSEEIFFGSDNGFIYQMDKGTSFDGENIEAYLTFHYLHSKTARRKKRYKNCTVEVSGGGYAEFKFSYELGYSVTDIPQPGSVTEIADFSNSVWDSGSWDSGFWDGTKIKPASFKLSGSAENISLLIRSNSDYFWPLVFSGAQIRFLYGRQLR